MAEREVPCSRCPQENPPTNRYCGSCGVPLTSGEQLATRQEHRPVPAGRAWPAKLGHVSRVLAVGVAALAAEAGLSWLRRKIGAEDRSSLPALRGAGSAPRGYLAGQRVWKKSSSGCGRIPTAGSSRGKRFDRSSPRGLPIGEGRTRSSYPQVGRSPRSGTQGLPLHFTFWPGAPHGTNARYAGWLL